MDRALLQGGIVCRPSDEFTEHDLKLTPFTDCSLLVRQPVISALGTGEKSADRYHSLPGTLVGALWGGWMGDRFGRIATIGFASVWAIVGATLQCSSQDANWMFCARVFNGIGTGILNAITPVWATETASHTSRGAFVSIEFTLNIFGVVVAYWIE